MRYRQVHLDFHTSGKLREIGAGFDKKQFQEMLRLGHVDSITLFSKCHHGYSFHPTQANEMHPGLSFDLLGEQLAACREIDVKAPVYISAGLDEKEAVRHPEWLVRMADESIAYTSDFTVPGYHRLCFNTSYLELLTAQLEEVMKRYQPEGVFLDIAAVHPCLCARCRQDIEERGKSILDEQAVLEQAELVYLNYTKRIAETVRKYSDSCTIFHNGGHIVRGKRRLAHQNTHLELESLPTGGWGYDHFPMSAAYVMNLDMDYLGMTGKFHTTWGEFGGYKHPNALRYEAGLSLAFGAKCSIGDQLHPSGRLNETTYRIIGVAYEEVERKEPWCKDAKPCIDVGVLGEEAVNAKTADRDTKCWGDIGANRMLLEGGYLYSFLDLECDFSRYQVIVLPDSIRLSQELADRLKNYLEGGGRILACGASGLKLEEDSFALCFGADYAGANPFRPDYYMPVEAGKDGDAAYVMYGQGHRVQNVDGTAAGLRRQPFFNRSIEHFSSHQHTPDAPGTEETAIVRTENTSYIGWEIFSDYANTGSLHAKKIVEAELDYLLGEHKTMYASLPDRGVMTLTRQEEEGRLVAHLLFAHTTIRGYFGLGEEKLPVEVIEDIVPLHNVKVWIREERPVKRVYLAPQMEELTFVQENGRVRFTVPKVECHQMVVVQC